MQKALPVIKVNHAQPQGCINRVEPHSYDTPPVSQQSKINAKGTSTQGASHVGQSFEDEELHVSGNPLGGSQGASHVGQSFESEELHVSGNPLGKRRSAGAQEREYVEA